MAEMQGDGGLQGGLAAIIGILEEQRDLQASLVSLSEKKIRTITAGDHASLQGIVDEEREVLGRIKQAEKKQAGCVGRLAALLNVPAHEVRMSLILSRAGGEQKETLERLRGELSDLVEKQLRCNDINMKLLQMNMDYVQFLINATSRQQAGSTYGSAGSLARPAASAQKLLDRKV